MFFNFYTTPLIYGSMQQWVHEASCTMEVKEKNIHIYFSIVVCLRTGISYIIQQMAVFYHTWKRAGVQCKI
ncbi:hypothetical protein GDO81_016334 [Engystomops pustulosus]|uniref:Uncharacterized protein n=1 Tax=Engystomops pustulosus TaxID=76066 RepID=A0AAV7ARC9_ENGPU|nr:hypothetical protein GDO81_016334 [Engystomops pustulosus]